MISIVYPIYNLTEEQKSIHINNWKSYPISLLEQVEIILVDDYSDSPLTLNIDFPINLTIARIIEDKYYNIGGAKNLGMTLAKDGWIFSSDIDHILTKDSLEKILNASLKKDTVYSFRRIQIRRNGSMEARPPHANSFMIEKGVFWKCGGYDEDMSGINGYGYEDALLNHQIDLHYNRDLLDISLIECEIFKTNRVSRDSSTNLKLLQNKISDKGYVNGKVLRFKWEILKSSIMFKKNKE